MMSSRLINSCHSLTTIFTPMNKTLVQKRITQMDDFGFEFFIRHSDEKVQQVSSLERKLTGTMLDVGPGQGTITSSLKPFFSRIDAVEENRSYCMQLKERGINVFNQRFESFESNERYDVVLASHIFTYFKNKEEMLKKMYDLLRVGGRLFIFNMTYRGLLAVIKDRIHPDIDNKTDDQIQHLMKDYHHEREIIPIKMKTKTVDEMLELIHFLSEKRPELWEKEKSNIRNMLIKATGNGGGYSLDYYNVLYTVYKI
jgi:2-polyprenyl-3-methyl-5-hydroxy-6-metoxy-1,4-benzoquinol methylase